MPRKIMLRLTNPNRNALPPLDPRQADHIGQRHDNHPDSVGDVYTA
jgi:hypothetical protein